MYAIRSYYVLFACTSKKSETIKPLLTAKDTITVIASGMTCTGCEQTIQGAIEKVPGVGSVTASHQDGKITVIRITSYNVCYTKLLRKQSAIRPTLYR